jgi:hypothetical protein
MTTENDTPEPVTVLIGVPPTVTVQTLDTGREVLVIDWHTTGNARPCVSFLMSPDLFEQLIDRINDLESRVPR